MPRTGLIEFDRGNSRWKDDPASRSYDFEESSDYLDASGRAKARLFEVKYFFFFCSHDLNIAVKIFTESARHTLSFSHSPMNTTASS